MLLSNHAKPMPGRSFHHTPGLHFAESLCAERLQSRDFGLDIVGLYIQVDAAGVINALNFDM